MSAQISHPSEPSARLTEVAVEDFILHTWGFLQEPPDNEVERRGCDKLWRPKRDEDNALGCSGRGCVIAEGDDGLKLLEEEDVLGILSAEYLHSLKWLLMEGEAEAG